MQKSLSNAFRFSIICRSSSLYLYKYKNFSPNAVVKQSFIFLIPISLSTHLLINCPFLFYPQNDVVIFESLHFHLCLPIQKVSSCPYSSSFSSKNNSILTKSIGCVDGLVI